MVLTFLLASNNNSMRYGSQILNMSDLCAGEIYHMHLVHFDEGLLGTPKRVCFKGYHNDRPVLKQGANTVILHNAGQDFGDQHEEDWLVSTSTGEQRTVKFSYVDVNLHAHLLTLNLLRSGNIYTMFTLKHHTDWDTNDTRIVKFKGWLTEDCRPVLQECSSRHRFHLGYDCDRDVWLTARGEAVLFVPSEDHFLSKQLCKDIRDKVRKRLHENDDVKVSVRLRLDNISHGNGRLSADTCRQDPVSLTTPVLSRAVYLESDNLPGDVVQCVYDVTSLADMMERSIEISPTTRKPFSKGDVKRIIQRTGQ